VVEENVECRVGGREMTELSVRLSNKDVKIFWTHPWVTREIPQSKDSSPAGTTLYKLSRCIVVEPLEQKMANGKPRFRFMGTGELIWMESKDGTKKHAIHIYPNTEMGRERARRLTLRVALEAAKLKREDRGAVWAEYFAKFHAPTYEGGGMTPPGEPKPKVTYESEKQTLIDPRMTVLTGSKGNSHPAVDRVYPMFMAVFHKEAC